MRGRPFDRQYDAIIADVPCSGYGVIRKKPEIRYKPLEDSASMPAIQAAILENLSQYVKPGGVIVYSTCTVLGRENEDVVKAFLRAHAEFSAEGFTLPNGETAADGYMYILAGYSRYRRIFCQQAKEKQMKNLRSMLPNEIEAVLADLGEPKYRAKQVFKWLGRGIGSIDEMSDIPKSLREKLKTEYAVYEPKVLSKQVSKIDGTIKYLWELYDGNAVETVVMSYKHGNTVCVSTQVGCRQGCAFCASTIGGLVRCLEPHEILEEVMFSQIDSGKQISNIVLMGIGEPLDNFDNVVKFLELVNHPDGMNIGMRHISLSTCGITEKFDKLAELNLQLTLSVSLHAPDDETRSKIMPANHGRGVDELMECCRRYYEKTGRRISFEYIMIDGVNDTQYHAELLSKRARYVGAHVNLIPMNHVEESRFQPSTQGHIKAFVKVLEDNGVNVTVRRKLGGDVEASCGQLRRKMQKGNQVK